MYGTTYLDPTTKKENGCHRSDVAEIATSGIPVDYKVNLACSGAETVHVLPAAAGGQDFKGQRPQADQLKDLAAKYDIKLVQLSISGNDLGFSKIIEDCVWQFLYGPVGRYCWKKWDWTVKQALAKEIPEKVGNVVDRIRSVMRQSGHRDGSYVLAIQSYPSPVPLSSSYRYAQGSSFTSNRYAPGGCPFYDQDTNWARKDVVNSIAHMLEGVADKKNLHYLDLQWAAQGHEVCADGVRQAKAGETLTSPTPGRNAEWMRFLSAGAARPQGQKEESFHPNSYGQLALGRCLGAFYDKVASGPHRKYECLNSPGQGPEGMHLKPLA
ncbi:GDSL-type esterase/lipase family protein [Streptomyces cinnamoneus]|uniref:SGNH hydrolase-type esterase domain-containing protein n=1 Tax=Streptomyces cinnamoneus TaxID=53446 RepID=A0A918TSS0_STRCJ|nr:GDSL-type esterase/lipase family protein [Streptomyces cinnamoneus]GHC57524.1 hypothetical protein GCM10010507_37720 [Streptomyces cinnamoneus]